MRRLQLQRKKTTKSGVSSPPRVETPAATDTMTSGERQTNGELFLLATLVHARPVSLVGCSVRDHPSVPTPARVLCVCINYRSEKMRAAGQRRGRNLRPSLI